MIDSVMIQVKVTAGSSYLHINRCPKIPDNVINNINKLIILIIINTENIEKRSHDTCRIPEQGV